MKRTSNFTLLLLMLCLLISGCSSQAQNQQGIKKIDEVPVIKSVQILDEKGKPLTEADGWINLQSDSIIEVNFEGEATHIDFYVAPTGTETYLEQRCIGNVDIEKGNNTAQLSWNVPDSFLGYIWVLVYNGDIARSSSARLINAIYDK